MDPPLYSFDIERGIFYRIILETITIWDAILAVQASRAVAKATAAVALAAAIG